MLPLWPDFQVQRLFIYKFVASCGNKNGGNKNATDSTAVAEEAAPAAAELNEEGVGPGILTTEKFVVDVPEGWKVIDKKEIGYITMRPADNGFATFSVNEKEGDIAGSWHKQKTEEHLIIGRNFFSEKVCGGKKKDVP